MYNLCACVNTEISFCNSYYPRGMAESAINIAAVVLDQSAADKQRHLPRAEICISDGPKIRYTAEGRDLGLRCSKY